MTSFRLLIASVAIPVLLSACGGSAPELPEDADDAEGGVRGDPITRVTDIPGLDLFGGDGAAGDTLTPVNRHLWRASLDTLAFLPLNSTDPFTGVIATDWASTPDAPEERFKVTAYVTSPSLATSSLKIAVFREIRTPEGAWVTAAVSGATARQLEDAILVRARQLRIADRESS